MGMLSVIAAGFVLIIAFYDRNLLIRPASRETIAIVSFALFAAAIVASLVLPGPVLFPSLMNPLLSLGLFLLMRKLFIRWKKREPLDTFMNWKRGLAADRLFNILYATLSVFLLLLLWIGAQKTGYKWH